MTVRLVPLVFVMCFNDGEDDDDDDDATDRPEKKTACCFFAVGKFITCYMIFKQQKDCCC